MRTQKWFNHYGKKLGNFFFIFLLLLLSHFSRVRLFVTLWTAAYQAPLSMGFSRQESLYNAVSSAVHIYNGVLLSHKEG